jgi:phosphate acetyltransferase
MEFLIRNLDKVAFFRPIISTQSAPDDKDSVIELISEHYNLEVPYERMYAYTQEEARALVAVGKHEELLDGILEGYKSLESNCNFVLCLGTDFEGESSAFEFEINAEIANNLGCPVLVVINAYDKELPEMTESCQFALESFEEKNCNVLSFILNRVTTKLPPDFQTTLKARLRRKIDLIYHIPNERTLGSLTLQEIATKLDLKTISGENQLNRPVSKFVVAAMHLENVLTRMTESSLIITPYDRLDIILGSLAAFKSQNFPNVAGLIITGDSELYEILNSLLDGMTDIFPILKSDQDTFNTATKINAIRPRIAPGDARKTAVALGLFEANVDTTQLRQKIVGYSVSSVTPKMFEFGLIRRARANKQHIVLPEGEDERILQAVEILIHRDAAEFTLLGNPKIVKNKIAKLGLELGNIDIVKPVESKKFEEYVETYYSLRKHKGITTDNARDVMSGVNHFGTMMVYKGDADGMVSGAMHSTLNTVRPALEFVKTRPGSTIMSSVIFMCLEDKVLVYGDCAVNPRPTAEQLAEIAIRSAETSRIFGIEPRIAMLSYSSGSSGKGSDVDKVREATLIAKKLSPDILIEGPIQYDAAIDLTVAKTKMPKSKVAGHATVFIFPDLNTGNNTYKAVQRSANAVAIGPIMQGLNKPVNDLSRGCLVPDIVNTIAITCIQAQAEKGLL